MKKLTMYKPLASFSLMMLLALWQLAAVQAQAINLPITGTDAVRCGAGELTLTVTWTGTVSEPDNVKWYDVPFYGEPIETGLSYNTGYIEFTQTFYVDYIGADDCSECDRLLVRAVIADQALPTQLIYPATAFCNNVDDVFTPTIVGVDVGVFEVQPLDDQTTNLLVVDPTTGAFNPIGVSTGVYRIVYEPEALEGCTPSTATVDITITAPLVQPVISYAETAFCGSETSAPVNLTAGNTGGTYSASPAGLSIDPNTGEINPSESSEGEYTVTYFLAATGGCPSVSGSTTVTINTVPIAGAAEADDAEVPNEGTTIIRLSGHSGSIQWQSSTDNESFADIENATAASYTTLELTQTTYFRAKVSNGVCDDVFSTVATVMVSGPSVAGTATADQETVCSGSTSVITLDGYTGTIQWQSDLSGGWLNLVGQTSETLTTPELEVTNMDEDRTVNFRAVVTNGLSAPDTSNEVAITVERPSDAGFIAGGGDICLGDDATIELFDNLGSIQWQSSIDNETFADIADETSATLTVTPTTLGNHYYRAEVTYGVCTPVYSDVITVTVAPTPVAGTASVDNTSLCVGGAAALSISGETGEVLWQYQLPSAEGVWIDFKDGDDPDAFVITEVGEYKFRAAVSSGTCPPVYTDELTVTSAAQPAWNITTAPESTIVYGESVSFEAVVDNGLGGIISWVRSSTEGGAGDDVTTPDTPPAVGTYYYRPTYSATGFNCSLEDGTEYTVEVTQKELTVIDAVVTTKPYDGNTDATITGAELSGLVSGDAAGTDVVLENHTSGTFDAETAGTHSVTTAMTISGAKAANYSLTQPDLTGTIEQLQLTIDDPTITKEKVYDGNTMAAVTAGTLQNVVESDDVSIVATTATYDNANVGTGKTITVEYAITGDAAGNYLAPVNFTSDDGVITEKGLTIIGAVADDKVYDGTTDAVVDFTSASLDGVVDGDVVSINSAGYSATFSQSDVGTDIVVTVTGVTLDGTAADNYEVAQPVGLTANITVAPLTITANNYDKGFGEVLTSPTTGSTEFTVGEGQLKGEDEVTSVTLNYLDDVHTEGKEVGEYPETIEPSDAQGSGLTNYDINYVKGTMTISAVKVESTSGSSTKKGYNTLKDAYDAINDGAHKGDIVVTIYANTDEEETAILKSSGEGSAEYDSVEIRAFTSVTISGDGDPLMILGD